MKKSLILFSICILCTLPTSAKRVYSEATYQYKWCQQHNGVAEYKLPDNTRIDCLTDTWAVEFDFADKWAECIGQCLYYGIRTDKQPVCGLIMERGEKDIKYLRRLRRVAYKKGIKTFTVKPEYIRISANRN